MPAQPFFETLMEQNKTQEYERLFGKELSQYLTATDKIDTHFPEMPDIENQWATVGESYLPDAMREYSCYPTVALGWVMYVGMAIAKYWDADWNIYGKVPDLYKYLLSQTDFDHLDDFITSSVLQFSDTASASLRATVGECASRVFNRLQHLGIESGTADAFRAFIAALHMMYLMGAAMELKHLGYHMTQVG